MKTQVAKAETPIQMAAFPEAMTLAPRKHENFRKLTVEVSDTSLNRPKTMANATHDPGPTTERLRLIRRHAELL